MPIAGADLREWSAAGMLNYIWAGLIVFSLVFALVKDARDIRNDTYRNGAALPVTIKLDKPGAIAANEARPVHVLMDPAAYHDFYHVSETPAESYPATLTKTAKGMEVRLAADVKLPLPLGKIRESVTPEDDRRLPAEVVGGVVADDAITNAGLKFQSLRFQTMADIANAGIKAAKDAV